MTSPRDWRTWAMALAVLSPLAVLMALEPIPQDPAYHILADARAYCGVPNFLNVASNIPFLIVGAVGLIFCLRRPRQGAGRSWAAFFLGVACVFAGSAYYHSAPDNSTLVWDRLPMTLAFMGLFAGLLAEHMGERFERVLLGPALAVGIASIAWWAHSDDLRLYVWVQFAPLVAIPLALATYPGRYTHRHYLIYGLAFYLLAKVAEFYDREIMVLTAQALSGHSLKHLLAACAPLVVYLMLWRRTPLRAPSSAA
jgi:hypothetical protein